MSVCKWLGVGALMALGMGVAGMVFTTARLLWLDWLAARAWVQPPCTESVLARQEGAGVTALACQGGARLHVWQGLPVCLCTPDAASRHVP